MADATEQKAATVKKAGTTFDQRVYPLRMTAAEFTRLETLARLAFRSVRDQVRFLIKQEYELALREKRIPPRTDAPDTLTPTPTPGEGDPHA